MNLNKIIQDLKAEEERLAAAIECLERLAAGRGRKRGRPPAWLKETSQRKQPRRNDRIALASCFGAFSSVSLLYIACTRS